MSKAATRGEELQHTLENAGAQIMASVDEGRVATSLSGSCQHVHAGAIPSPSVPSGPLSTCSFKGGSLKGSRLCSPETAVIATEGIEPAPGAGAPAVLQVRMKRANSAGVRPSRHGFRRQPNASLATPPRWDDDAATAGGDARAGRAAVATLAAGRNAFQPAMPTGFTTPGESELILGRPAPTMQSSHVYD